MIHHMKHVLKVLAANDISVVDKEVLDVECELGEGTQILYEAGASAMGTTASPTAIAKCRLRYPYCGFIETDIPNIRGWYDIVIANHTLEPIDVIIESLRAVCDILIISTPGVTTYDAHPPTIIKERVAIWMD